ncbi:MAG: hypothetical protein ACT4PT_14550, partial [Methanobacteriota archaeon]
MGTIAWFGRPLVLDIVAEVGVVAYFLSPRLVSTVIPQVLSYVATGAIYATLVLFALRFPVVPGHQARNVALVSMALMLLLGVNAGDNLLDLFRPAHVVGVVQVGLWVLISVLWIRNTRFPGGSRVGRDLAVLSVGLPLLGAVLHVALGIGRTLDDSPHFGIARTLGFGVLAYAILRHQLLGLDVKVKWTLKQSTVAATFIAVSFVVSESASTFFAGSVGPYLGIAAAGLLVFAFAPLQHLAQRVADKAMPGVKAVGEMNSEERAAAYREMLRVAWRDGNVDKSER